MTVILVSVGALFGSVGVGCAAIAIASINSGVTLCWTSKCINLPLSSLGKTLLQSAKVILPSSVGPLLALWIYGLTPESLLLPLAVSVGVGGGGFVAGIFSSTIRSSVRSIRYGPRFVVEPFVCSDNEFISSFAYH